MNREVNQVGRWIVYAILLVIINIHQINAQIPVNDMTWDSIFYDAFNSLDTSRWNRNYPWGKANNGLELCIDSNLIFQSGWLKIKTDTLVPNTDYGGKSYKYQGGILRSKASYKYGYFETSSKMPVGRGLWPAFWLLKINGCTWYNEIDINEPGGPQSETGSKTTLNYLWKWAHVDSCRSSPNQAIEVNVGNTAQEHKYGVLWQPGKMTWFLDDSVVYAESNIDSTPSNAMEIYLNFAIDPWNPPNGGSVFPKYYETNWIKVHQLKRACDVDTAPCPYNHATYDRKIKKSISLGGAGCSSSLSTQDQISLWATDYILLSDSVTLNQSGTGFISLNISACPN